MNITTTNTTKKTPFFNSKALTAAYETIIYADDFPRLPGEAEHKAILAGILQSVGAAKLIETIATEAVELVQAHARKCSGDAWNAAAADLHMLAIDLAVENSFDNDKYVVADYLIKRIGVRVGLTVCTSKGLEHLRALLLDTVGPICYLAGQQEELELTH